jgi:orotidine-5'-phosphate decarboxylase
MTFTKKLADAVSTTHSTLCVGLDPNIDLLPDTVKTIEGAPTQKVEYFLKKVIEATVDHCAAYKPNLGFFEALGADGWDIFAEILDYIPDNKIIIADAKRGDISSTSKHYAKAFFEQFEVDAVTLNPLMGFETLDPFLNNAGKCIYVLTLTSNPGANDIFLQKLSNGDSISTFISKELYKKQQNHDTAIGMVVGATKTPSLKPVIKHYKKAPLLIPGVGKQGGSIKELAKVLNVHEGIPLVNSSRSIIYAGSKTKNWEQSVTESAMNFKNRLSPITKKHV